MCAWINVWSTMMPLHSLETRRRQRRLLHGRRTRMLARTSCGKPAVLALLATVVACFLKTADADADASRLASIDLILCINLAVKFMVVVVLT